MEWQKLVQEKMSRRNFMRGLAALGASTAVRTAVPAAALGAIVGAAASARAQEMGLPFTPIEPSSQDDIVLPEGFSYQVIIKRGDVFTKDGKAFGENADWTGWYPIDMLTGGNSTEEGLLVVNNEYLNPLLVSGYADADNATPKTVEQIRMEKEVVGFAIVHLRKVDGQWTVVTDSDFARRFDAAGPMIELTGPAAGSAALGGATAVVGSAANCSGGQTPWFTALSCEENYQDYYGEDSVNEVSLERTYRWLEDAENAQRPEHYGWVVEVDPFTGVAKKRTAMGRFRHENVAIGIGKSGKVVAYMGDDSRDECVYKFVSNGVYNPDDRAANMDILAEGTLYVANFGSGKWIPVVWEGNEERFANPIAKGYVIAGQADMLTYTNEVARLLGGTRTDRPEDIEIHPLTGDIYIAFTNNSNHGNFHGQITRIMEKDGDFESVDFLWDIFAVGGPQSGFSSPDNLVFDPAGNLWVVTDVSSSSINKGIYQFMGNNALFFIPTSGDNAGKAFRFATGPMDCELTGPTFLDNNTLILSVQHPGENSESLEALTSNWPVGNGDQPRSAVIAVTGPFMG
jgi:uncharacterized protein